MSRRVITQAMHATAATPKVDTYFDKVVKYIPADIVGAWIAVTGLIASAADVPKSTLLWICFGVGLLLTPAWTLKQTSVANLPPAYKQAGISTAAFAVWIFALGGPFATLAFYQPLYGSLLLIFFTLSVPLIK